MSLAAKILTDELAYLRSMHAEAVSQGATIIANSIASDIADCEQAMQLIVSLQEVQAEAARAA